MLTFALAAAALMQDGAAVDPANPQSVVEAMQDNGYRAKLDEDGNGDPMITSGAAGAIFNIYFYDCVEAKNCKTMMFGSGYDFDDDKVPDPKKLHEFDREFRFVRTFADAEGDPYIEMDIQISDGPVDRALFLEALQIFSANMGEFQEFIGWN